MMRDAMITALLMATVYQLPAHARQAVNNTAPKPGATATPAEAIATGVTPIGDPGDWFPLESYPPEARIAAQEGRTQFSLDIDAAGRITVCNIIESSGSDLLDSTTCSQLIANGRFNPALDRHGKAVPGTWKSAMRWRLSDIEGGKE
jgi:protein TonB